MNESAPPAPERSWKQLRLSTLLCLTAMVAVTLGGVKTAQAVDATAIDLPLVGVAALWSCGPVCCASFLLIGGRRTAQFLAIGLLVIVAVLVAFEILTHYSVSVPDRLVLAMWTLQTAPATLGVCAVFGAAGYVLERISPVRMLVSLPSLFCFGYWLGAFLFGRIGQ